jgi:hypothetical protein
MSDQPHLPPSERDFEIFFAVAFYSVSTRRAAEQHHISQTRVRQIVALVGDWVADNLPDWGEADLKKQVRLAQHIAANRLEHLYEQAMNYWNAEGDPKYHRAATRIALAQARLGVVAGRIHALAADVTSGPSDLRGADIPVCHTSTRSVSEGSGAGLWPATETKEELVTATAPDNALPPVPCRLSPDPLPEDCSPFYSKHATGEPTDDDDPALTDSPETLIECERQARLSQLEGLSIMERRLLTLIENEGSSNPDKVASLNTTLSRVRASKATAELRLSRFIRGVHIEPLNVQPHPTEIAHEDPAGPVKRASNCSNQLTTAH